MLFEFGFNSSILLIFLFHALVYAFLLARKSMLNDSAADKYLSIFLLLCAMYIAPWTLGFGGWYDNQPYRDILFYVPFHQLFFIGPIIFFYVQAVLNPSFRFGRNEWLQLLPGFLYLLYSLVIVITDKLILKKYFFLADGADRDFDTWYQLTGYVSMITYFFLSIRYYNRYRQLILNVVSYADAVMFKWIRNFLFAFLTIILARFTLFTLALFINMDYWDVWWFFLTFSVCFYYIAIEGYANAVVSKTPFQTELFSARPALLIPPVADPLNQYEDAIIIDEETIETREDVAASEEWKLRILDAVLNEKLFEEPELSLTDLAKKLNTNTSVLSRAVNRGFEMNFNDLINYYRVQAMMEKFRQGEHRTQTLLGLAFGCGFNSKATFNRAFKKVTNQSPKDWIARECKY